MPRDILVRRGVPWRLVGFWICHSRMTTRGPDGIENEHDHFGIIVINKVTVDPKLSGKDSNAYGLNNSSSYYLFQILCPTKTVMEGC